MKLAALFSGGKDSTYALWLAKQAGHEIVCLVSLFSENKDSYMFHTPSITKTAVQSKAMGIPLLIKETKGEKETELQDLQEALHQAKHQYGIEGVVTGAVESVYQASRVQRVCQELSLDCFNPLWQKNQLELLEELVKRNFEVIIVGVAAYPLDTTWLGKKIDRTFIEAVRKLQKEYGFNPAGEGGEYETLVLDGPLFTKKLEIQDYEDFGEGHSWRREVELG